MKELQRHPLGLQFYEEMYCRKHIREKCPSHHKPLQDFGMQAAEAIMRRISIGIETISETTTYPNNKRNIISSESIYLMKTGFHTCYTAFI